MHLPHRPPTRRRAAAPTILADQAAAAAPPAHTAPPSDSGAPHAADPAAAQRTPSWPAGLYVVATPIGRLADLSQYASEVFRAVDVVAAEDTRVTRILLDHVGAHPTLIASHEHNEAQRAHDLIARIRSGQRVALTSDAGTPGISDPGARVVAAVHAAGLPVFAVPGPAAVVTLLSVAGLQEPRFRFEGFLPTRSAARRERLAELAHSDIVVVFYESPHRILATVDDLAATLEPSRTVVLGRELTKRFEQIHRAPAQTLPDWLRADPDRQRGEFVLAIEAAAPQPATEAAADPWLRALCEVMPLRQAARLAARVTGLRANDLYARAQALRGTTDPATDPPD